MRLVYLSTILASLSLGSVLGCTDSHPLPTALSPVEAGRASMPTVDLATEIDNLIRSGYAGGTRQAINSRWSNVVRQNERERNGQLSNGRKGPAAAARKQLTELVAFLEWKTDESTPSAGETRTHFVTRLVLDMSLYIYAGPATPVPVLTATSDVVLKVVVPTQTDTVATPALQAAVIFPAGAVAEPTIVVVSPVSTYYPANCSGPLDTGLCQYPNFYHFNVFPDVKLAVPAQVQVCHVDAGTNRLPLANHVRFRVAHEKPANEADYSAGSTIVDNVEVLALVPLMNVTNCEGGTGTTYTPPVTSSASRTPLGQMRAVAARLMHRTLVAATRALTPRNAYAIDVGGGGSAELFSVFGIVDPLGKPDLAFTSSPTVSRSDALPGDPLTVGPYTFTNAGSATAGAFSNAIVLATDTALIASAVTLASPASVPSLVPRSNVSAAASSVTIPTSIAPGTYFIGIRADIGGTVVESDETNNVTSVRIVVRKPVDPNFALDVGDAAACALDAYGVAYCWGTSTTGALGNGTLSPSTAPVLVSTAADGTELHFAQIGISSHACGVTDHGSIYCWGGNAAGNLGNGTTTSSSIPVRVLTPAGLSFQAVYPSIAFTCALAVDGSAWCWGKMVGTYAGQLGTAARTGSLVPVRVDGSTTFASLSAGVFGACGHTATGAAYCWGDNRSYGQYGVGLPGILFTPTPIQAGATYDRFETGAIVSCGVRSGHGFCWGSALFGALGRGTVGTDTSSRTAKEVSGGLTFARVLPSTANNILIATCGLTPSGTAYCWGGNYRGQLGSVLPSGSSTCNFGTFTFACTGTPQPVSGGFTFRSLFNGSTTMCGLTVQHDIVCWGSNQNGTVGNGGGADVSTPVRVNMAFRAP